MLKTPNRILAVIYALSTAALGTMAIASLYKQIPVGMLTRDPATVIGFHPFTGFLSNLGILLWCSAAITCLFSGTILYQLRHNALSQFLISSGLLTSILLFDDLFLFHEFLVQRFLGLRENTVLITYGIITATYLIVFRNTILQTKYSLFCLALAFFAASLIMDVILKEWLERLDPWDHLFEDGAKFLGIVSWCSYYIQTSFRSLIAPISLGSNQRND